MAKDMYCIPSLDVSLPLAYLVGGVATTNEMAAFQLSTFSGIPGLKGMAQSKFTGRWLISQHLEILY